MFPIFLWVREYKCLKNFSINLDNNYDIALEVKDLVINKIRPKRGRRHLGTSGYIKKSSFGFSLEKLSIIKKDNQNNDEKFYGDNIDSVKAIVGKNGTGKSSILELLSKFTKTNKQFYEDQLEDISFLIIYKTNEFDKDGKEVFILEGYTNYYKDEYFKFLKEIPKETDFINYFSFKMNIENKFLNNLDGKVSTNLGVIRLTLNDQIEKEQIKYIHDENEYRNNQIYKLNLNYKHVAKNKVCEYIRSLNEKKENYLNFKFSIKIFERNYHLSLINEKYMEFEEYPMNDNIYLSIIKKDETIKNIILSQCYNNLYQYELYNKIKNFSTIEEIENCINSTYDFYTNKVFKDEVFDRLLENIEEIENKDLLKNKIQDLCSYLEILENKKIITKINKFKFEIDLNKIKSDDYIDAIKSFLNFYDQEITYEWSNDLSTDEIRNILVVSEEGMSEGEKIRLNQFTTFFRVLDGEFSEKKYVTLLLDEAESFLHPEWCRTLVNDYLNELIEKYKDKEFKLIFATHSPFILSDLLSKDTFYLEKPNSNEIIVRTDTLKSFGGNIHNLLKENMFMKSTFGEFAKNKIQKFVENIKKENVTFQELEMLSQNILLQEIGEPLIRKRLKVMIDEEINRKKDKDYYEHKILEYKAKIAEYENELKTIEIKKTE